MVKVITYGTYDLLHYGHIRLLERAKALGDYLIVGVTSDDFDKKRGKINVQQSLAQRLEAVRATGIADEIIVEEYEGQKIDDIKRYGVDIFTVGDDWVGVFDYLNEYCEVVYLSRTQGVSSTGIRSQKGNIDVGLVGNLSVLNKFYRECGYVNGVKATCLWSDDTSQIDPGVLNKLEVVNTYDALLEKVDAVYVHSNPKLHYEQVKTALNAGKHVLCETPIALSSEQAKELFQLAKDQDCVLLEGLKTAYSTAFSRMLLLVKGGNIGDVVSIEATCTSLKNYSENEASKYWNSIGTWGPTALLPVFQLLGTEYIEKRIITHLRESDTLFDTFTQINFVYPAAVASIKVGNGVKSEGELIISGTKGYVYVPAPWWKTDYFEIRYENPADNKRYFYKLDGEGIRYEIVAFAGCINHGRIIPNIDQNVSCAIARILNDFNTGKDVIQI